MRLEIRLPHRLSAIIRGPVFSHTGPMCRSRCLSPSSTVFATFLFAGVVFCLLAWLPGRVQHAIACPGSFASSLTIARPVIRRTRVMMASAFAAHDDVSMSAFATLERLLPKGQIKWIGPGFRWGLLEQVLKPLGVYDQPLSPLLRGLYDTKMVVPTDLVAEVNGEWPDGAGAQMVVLGTCEIDMEAYSDALFEAWLNRPANEKFNVVCIVHDNLDWGWALRYISDWARVGALSLMPISEHVALADLESLTDMAEEPEYHHVGLQHIRARAHVPVLPIERLPSFNSHRHHPGQYVASPAGDGMGEIRALEEIDGETWTWGRRDGKILRDVLIQGRFDEGCRDYRRFFADLLAEIEADPELWGYVSGPIFEPANSDAFRVHLAGHGDPSFIPPKLKHVVVVHVDLSYPDFFSLAGSVDVIVPAFHKSGNYLTRQASSTVAMAMQCETPLLASDRMMTAYTYLTPQVTIIRPQSMQEVTALAAFRRGSYRPPARGFDHAHERSHALIGIGNVAEHRDVEGEAKAMIARGFFRPEADWRAFKKALRRANEEVMLHWLSV